MDSLEMGDQEGASFASDKSSIFVAVNVLSARRSFFQTSFKQRISFMGRLCLQNMHEINNSRISCFLFDIIKRIWIIWEWNPVQGLLWQYFFFILLSLTGDLYVTIQAPSFHVMSNPPTNLVFSQAMPGFFKAPVKLPSSNNAIGDGGHTAGSYDSQGWDGYIIYLRLHLLQEQCRPTSLDVLVLYEDRRYQRGLKVFYMMHAIFSGEHSPKIELKEIF